MAKKIMNANKVINGSFGKVMLDGEKLGNIKSFEAKATATYEDVNISESLGTGSKYMGFTIEGTMTLHKIDSFLAEKIGNGIRTGNMPTFTIVASLDDPSSYGTETVQLSGVTFDELTLMSFEVKALGEEEIPFKAQDFKYLDTI